MLVLVQKQYSTYRLTKRDQLEICNERLMKGIVSEGKVYQTKKGDDDGTDMRTGLGIGIEIDRSRGMRGKSTYVWAGLDM